MCIHVSSHFALVDKPQSTRQVAVCLLRGSNVTENESAGIQASSCDRRDWNFPALEEPEGATPAGVAPSWLLNDVKFDLRGTLTNNS